MKNFLFLKSFERKQNLDKTIDDVYDLISSDHQNRFNLAKPNSEIFPFVFNVYDYTNEQLLYCQFLQFTPLINKYTFSISDNFIPVLRNINIFYGRNSDTTCEIYNHTYYDGSKLHVYATTYMEAIDLFLTIVNGKHHFMGFNDYNYALFNEKYKSIENISKIVSKKDRILALYN